MVSMGKETIAVVPLFALLHKSHDFEKDVLICKITFGTIGSKCWLLVLRVVVASVWYPHIAKVLASAWATAWHHLI